VPGSKTQVDQVGVKKIARKRTALTKGALNKVVARNTPKGVQKETRPKREPQVKGLQKTREEGEKRTGSLEMRKKQHTPSGPQRAQEWIGRPWETNPSCRKN